jgi:glycerol-3-phosphate dehydrogenase (NAD(P)+)
MIGVIGAGAFGTALAIALGRDARPVTLWARQAAQVQSLRETGMNAAYVPGVALPETVSVSAKIDDMAQARVILLAVPMQALGGFLSTHRLPDVPLVACCKGIDLATLQGPTSLIRQTQTGPAAVLTGPSFAIDIAQGLPTALTLACADDAVGVLLQQMISTPTLRIYRSSDVTGAELGGALKNIVAIAAGIVVGAGLGDSARAALMTRGFAEMTHFASRMGARPETLMGLSGFGDLVLTCTSIQSRNFSHGQALGRGVTPDPRQTVEGIATAKAVMAQAARLDMAAQMPVTFMVTEVTAGRIGVAEAVQHLMSRPLKEE